MKYTILPSVSIPSTLTARPKIRKLGEHRAAFHNVNNLHGWTEEKCATEATKQAPLTIRSRSYEIGTVLNNAIAQPNMVDALTTGLPYRLRIYFMQVEKAVAEKKAVKEAKLRTKELYWENERLQSALSPYHYREDPLKEVYHLVHGYPDFEGIVSNPNSFRNHLFTTRTLFSYRAVIASIIGDEKWTDSLFDKALHPLCDAEYRARREQLQ